MNPQDLFATPFLAGNRPRILADVPAAARVDETFGAAWAALAVASFGAFVGMLVDPGDVDGVHQLGVLVGSLAAGLLCTAAEVLRRRRRISLVFGQGDIGVYAHGRLLDVVLPDEITRYELNHTNSLREMIVFVAAIVGGVVLAAHPDVHDPAMAGPTFFAVGLMIAGGVGLVGSVWCRWRCSHYVVPLPRPYSRGKIIALPKAVLARLAQGPGGVLLR